MKILFWNPTYVLGGGFNLLSNLLRHLSLHPEVTQITAAIHRDYDTMLPDGSWNAKVRRVLIDGDTPIEPMAAQHDVVYMTWPHGVAIPPVAAPTVCIFQDTILLDAYGFHTTKNFLHGMERAVHETVQGYSTVIVTSHYTRQRFVDLVGESAAERVVVLPHIASEPPVLSELSQPDRSTTFHDPSALLTPPCVSGPYFLYPANVSEHKNHLALMIALSKRQRTDTKLVLCGYGTEAIGGSEPTDNPYLNRLNKAIHDRGLRRGIDFDALGYVTDEQTESLLSHASGLVMPTRAEGMGLPIHEAIERKLPVIASDIPVLREHYDARSNAILWVDPECPGDIAEAWDRLCSRGDSYRALARESNQSSGVSWDDLADQTVGILNEAIQSHRPVVRVPLRKHRRWMKKIERSIKKLWRPAA